MKHGAAVKSTVFLDSERIAVGTADNVIGLLLLLFLLLMMLMVL